MLPIPPYFGKQKLLLMLRVNGVLLLPVSMFVAIYFFMRQQLNFLVWKSRPRCQADDGWVHHSGKKWLGNENSGHAQEFRSQRTSPFRKQWSDYAAQNACHERCYCKMNETCLCQANSQEFKLNVCRNDDRWYWLLWFHEAYWTFREYNELPHQVNAMASNMTSCGKKKVMLKKDHLIRLKARMCTAQGAAEDGASTNGELVVWGPVV